MDKKASGLGKHILYFLVSDGKNFDKRIVQVSNQAEFSAGCRKKIEYAQAKEDGWLIEKKVDLDRYEGTNRAADEGVCRYSVV